MSEHVRVERRNGLLAITLARPERRNAITVAMYAALANAIESAADDPSLRVISFAGEGQDFAAGNDLADFLDPARDGEVPVWQFLRALVRCDLPLVAAVHGNCVGIGTTFLLHCDLVVADETAQVHNALRRPRARPRGSELITPAPTRRPPARGPLPAARGAFWGR